MQVILPGSKMALASAYDLKNLRRFWFSLNVRVLCGVLFVLPWRLSVNIVLLNGHESVSSYSYEGLKLH